MSVIVEFNRLLVLVVDEVRRKEAAIELHAFDDSTVVSLPRPSSTVITPSLPTFVKASASTLPIEGSLFPAIAAIWVSRFLSPTSTGLGLFGDRFVDDRDGLIDAAAERHSVGTSGNHLQAFAEDALGEHGGSRRTVASDVVRLAGGFLDELGA